MGLFRAGGLGFVEVRRPGVKAYIASGLGVGSLLAGKRMIALGCGFFSFKALNPKSTVLGLDRGLAYRLGR